MDKSLESLGNKLGAQELSQEEVPTGENGDICSRLEHGANLNFLVISKCFISSRFFFFM